MTLDTYEYAEQLKKMASDLRNDITGVSVTDIYKTLTETSEIIVALTDDLNHYKMKNKVAVIIDGAEVELDEDIVDRIREETMQEWIESALRMYMSVPKVVR